MDDIIALLFVSFISYRCFLQAKRRWGTFSHIVLVQLVDEDNEPRLIQGANVC